MNKLEIESPWWMRLIASPMRGATERTPLSQPDPNAFEDGVVIVIID